MNNVCFESKISMFLDFSILDNSVAVIFKHMWFNAISNSRNNFHASNIVLNNDAGRYYVSSVYIHSNIIWCYSGKEFLPQ